MFSFVLVAASLASITFPVATPQGEAFQELLKLHPYKAPGPNDLRSSCPGLNTLANHGFINRDGREINRIDLQAAMEVVYNFSPIGAIDRTFNKGLGFGYSSYISKVDNKTVVMDLHSAGFHRVSADILGEIVEHDASMMREDSTANGIEDGGKQNPQSISLIEGLLSAPSRYPNRVGPPGYFDTWVIYNYRYEILDRSWKIKGQSGANVWHPVNNPNGWYYNNTLDFSATTSEAFFSSVEAAFVLVLFGGSKGEATGYLNNTADPAFIEAFCLHERIPEGWNPPSRRISAAEMNLVAKNLYDIGPQQKFLGF